MARERQNRMAIERETRSNAMSHQYPVKLMITAIFSMKIYNILQMHILSKICNVFLTCTRGLNFRTKIEYSLSQKRAHVQKLAISKKSEFFPILMKLYNFLQMHILLEIRFFNPILHGGGPADPPWRYISHDASVDGPMELKFHDFVSFYICYV